MTHRFNRYSVVSLAAMLFLATGSLLATVDDVSGDVAFVEALPSVMPTASVNADFIFAFREKRDVGLPASLLVDAVPGDVVDPTHPLAIPTVVLNQGTCVSSYYVIYEPGIAGSTTGTIRFTERVLGVELTAQQLDATNFLGDPATVYPLSPDCANFSNGDCAPEVAEVDRVIVGEHEVGFEFHATQPGDRIRIITAGDLTGC